MADNWKKYPTNSNYLKKSYAKNFIDVSGNFYIRNGNLTVLNGDISATSGTLTCNNLTSKIGINATIQTALNAKQAILTAGTNIEIVGNVINAQVPSAYLSNVVAGSANTVTTRCRVNVAGDLGVTGSIRVNGTVVHSSDDRLKINESKLPTTIPIINKLVPYTYDKKDDMYSTNTTIKESGFVAQELWYLTPELRHLIATNSNLITDKIYKRYDGPTPHNDAGCDACGDDYVPLTDISYVAVEADITDISNNINYAMYGWSDKPAAINYTGLISYLIKYIKELNDKVVATDLLIEQYKQQI